MHVDIIIIPIGSSYYAFSLAMLSILVSNELSVTALSANIGNGIGTIACGENDVVSMQWSIVTSDMNIVLDWDTIDESTDEDFEIVTGMVMSSTYRTSSRQPPYSIESVITVSPAFSGGAVSFTCSGDRVSGSFTSRVTASFQGSAPTTSQFITSLTATLCMICTHDAAFSQL